MLGVRPTASPSQMDVEATAGGTEPTDQAGGGGGLAILGNLGQSEPRALAGQPIGERPVALGTNQ